MFYIHQSACISPQQTVMDIDLNKLYPSAENILKVIEPEYNDIPPGILRRMGKSVRMAVGTALSLINKNTRIDGIIMGTANGGKEDCVKFLSQVIEHNEGLLTPLSFVQSTPNAAAAQIGLLTHNHNYNITHVQSGLAFEYAMVDADIMIAENHMNQYLLGAVDDISPYNYSMEEKSGCYKAEIFSNKDLYQSITPGSIAGEAGVMFLVNGNADGSLAKVSAIETLHHTDQMAVKEKLNHFIQQYLPSSENIDLFLTGENGDVRLLKYYEACEETIANEVALARFKHMSGEYPTAIAMAIWISCHILQNKAIPFHMIKRFTNNKSAYKNILIYNTYKGIQHSFILVSAPC
jgi:Beta-ketoacyl synthase, N-terminal domain